MIKDLVDDIILISKEEILRFFNALVQRDSVVLESTVVFTTVVILGSRISNCIKGNKSISVISKDNIDMIKISEILPKLK